MTSLSRINADEVRLVSAAENEARRRRLWGPPASARSALPANRNAPLTPAPDAVALYRLAFSSEEAATPPVPAPAPPGKGEPAKNRRPPDRASLMAEVEAIAVAHRVSVADIRGSSRTPAARLARREACYVLATSHPELSYHAIGALLRKDHTSIHYAAHRHAKLTGLPPVMRS